MFQPKRADITAGAGPGIERGSTGSAESPKGSWNRGKTEDPRVTRKVAGGMPAEGRVWDWKSWERGRGAKQEVG